MPKELVVAPAPVVEAVIAEAIVPCVRQLEQERGQAMPLRVTQWLAESQGPTIAVSGDAAPHGFAGSAGEMRLSFRRNYGGDRYLFRGQAVYPKGFTQDRGFSGFTVEGGVDVECDRPVRVKYDGWTVNWNDRGFSKWY
jgi:hypothetical protein